VDSTSIDIILYFAMSVCCVHSSIQSAYQFITFSSLCASLTWVSDRSCLIVEVQCAVVVWISGLYRGYKHFQAYSSGIFIVFGLYDVAMCFSFFAVSPPPDIYSHIYPLGVNSHYFILHKIRLHDLKMSQINVTMFLTTRSLNLCCI
jgi:hypothetical protein